MKLRFFSKKISWPRIWQVLSKHRHVVRARNKTPKETHVVQQDDLDFVADSQSAVIAKTTPFANVVLYVIVSFILVGLVWAHFAIIDEVTHADGKIVPSSQVQMIQNLEGGILSTIDVSEGQIVKKGQILVRIDDTRFASQYREGHGKYLTILATIARLHAEAQNKTTIDFPEAVKTNNDLVERETDLFRQRKHAVEHSIDTLQRNYKLAKKELAITKPLVKKGVMSKIELLRLQRETNDFKRKLNEQQDGFREKALTELTKQKAEKTTLAESLLALEDRMKRTTVRSPVKGIVKQIYINTIGGVIKPGQDIMEIVPLDTTLLVEARVRPADIAFIHPKQQASVKITAYDFAIYGGLKGTIEHISADTSNDEQGNPYFEIFVRTNKNFLGNKKDKLPIMPGMTARVDILTGRKSVLAYLLKPILRAKEKALRER